MECDQRKYNRPIRITIQSSRSILLSLYITCKLRTPMTSGHFRAYQFNSIGYFIPKSDRRYSELQFAISIGQIGRGKMFHICLPTKRSAKISERNRTNEDSGSSSCPFAGAGPFEIISAAFRLNSFSNLFFI